MQRHPLSESPFTEMTCSLFGPQSFREEKNSGRNRYNEQEEGDKGREGVRESSQETTQE